MGQNKVIQAEHVAQFYGLMMARVFSDSSIENMFAVCEWLDAVSCVKEAITQYALKYIYWCMHFVDDWEADTDDEQDE